MADGTLTPPESDWSKRIKAAIAPKPNSVAPAIAAQSTASAIMTGPAIVDAAKRFGSGFTAPLPDKAVPSVMKPVERTLAAPEGSRRAMVAEGTNPVTGAVRDLTNPATLVSPIPIMKVLSDFLARGVVSEGIKNPVRTASEVVGYGPATRAMDAAGNMAAEGDPIKAAGAGTRAVAEGGMAALSLLGEGLAAKEGVGAAKRALGAAKAAKVPAFKAKTATDAAPPSASNDIPAAVKKFAQEDAADKEFWSKMEGVDPQYSRAQSPIRDYILDKADKASDAEIAATYDKSPKAVGVMLSRERAKIRTRLESEAPEQVAKDYGVTPDVIEQFKEKLPPGKKPDIREAVLRLAQPQSDGSVLSNAVITDRIRGMGFDTTIESIKSIRSKLRNAGYDLPRGKMGRPAINPTAPQPPIVRPPEPDYAPTSQAIMSGLREREVLKNPSISTIGKMLREQSVAGQPNPVRYWVDDQGNAHVWNSDFGFLHDDVAQGLKLDPAKGVKGTLETPDDIQEFNLAVRNARRNWAKANGYSRGAIPGLGSSVKDLTKAVRDSWGADTRKLLGAGRIKIVETVDDLPPTVSGAEHPIDARAVTDRNTGNVWIVAENMPLSKAKGVVLHEIGEHTGMEDMLGAERYGKLMEQMKKLEVAGNKDVVAAYERARKLAPEDADREAIAYLLEAKPNAPISVKFIQAIREWVNRNFGTVKSFLRGREVNLSTEDIRQLGVASLRRAAQKASKEVVYYRGYDGADRRLPNPESPVWFAHDKDFASDFADKENPTILETPLNVRKQYKPTKEERRLLGTSSVDLTDAEIELKRAITAKAKAAGYDSILNTLPKGDYWKPHGGKRETIVLNRDVIPNSAKNGAEVDPLYAFGSLEDKAARTAWANSDEVRKTTSDSEVIDSFRKAPKKNYSYTFNSGNGEIEVAFRRVPGDSVFEVEFFDPAVPRENRFKAVKAEAGKTGPLGESPSTSFGKIAGILERFAEEHNARTLKIEPANDRLARVYSQLLTKAPPEGWSAWDVSGPRTLYRTFVLTKGDGHPTTSADRLKYVFGEASPLKGGISKTEMDAKNAAVRDNLNLPRNFSFSRAGDEPAPRRTRREKIADFIEGKSPPKPEPKTPAQFKARGMERLAELAAGVAGGAAGGAVTANSMIVGAKRQQEKEAVETAARAARIAKMDREVKTFRFERDNPVEAIPAEISMDDKIRRIAKRQEVPSEFLGALVNKESGGDPDAKATTSSATGATQFIDGTWKKVLAEDPAALGFKGDPESPEALELRKDPRWAISAAAVHAKTNADALRRALKREPTQGEVYVAHFLGIDGAKTALKADPKQVAAALLPKAAEANVNVFYIGGDKSKPRTVQQVIDLQTKGFSKEPFKAEPADVSRKLLKSPANPQPAPVS